jgi:hypothetical protein
VTHLVEALRHEPKGRGFIFLWGDWNCFNYLNPSGHTMALGSTQSLIEMSSRNLLEGLKTAGA